jgi:hypothetical protein
MTKEKKNLYIDAGTVIVNLLKEERGEYLQLKRLDRLVDYIYEQLGDFGLIDYYSDIIFNVSFDAIERTVLYNNNLFELIGDTIFLKSDIPVEILEKYSSDECIVKIIHSFVEKKLA